MPRNRGLPIHRPKSHLAQCRTQGTVLPTIVQFILTFSDQCTLASSHFRDHIHSESVDTRRHQSHRLSSHSERIHSPERGRRLSRETRENDTRKEPNDYRMDPIDYENRRGSDRDRPSLQHRDRIDRHDAKKEFGGSERARRDSNRSPHSDSEKRHRVLDGSRRRETDAHTQRESHHDERRRPSEDSGRRSKYSERGSGGRDEREQHRRDENESIDFTQRQSAFSNDKSHSALKHPPRDDLVVRASSGIVGKRPRVDDEEMKDAETDISQQNSSSHLDESVVPADSFRIKRSQREPLPRTNRKSNLYSDDVPSSALASNSGIAMDNSTRELTDEERMQQMLGFGSFGTTKVCQYFRVDLFKGKHVDDVDLSTVANKRKERKYRQYMNRIGGFNRPLDKT